MHNYIENLYKNKKSNTSYPKKLTKYLIASFFKPAYKDVLDIGPGIGYFMDAFQDSGYSVVGVDECPYDDRDKRHEVHNENLFDNQFDVVFSKSVIEHMENPSSHVEDAYRALRPGGKFIVMTPSWKHQWDTFWDDYTHVRPYSLPSIKSVIEEGGFDVEVCQYFTQLPFYWSKPYLKPLIWLLSLFRRVDTKLTKFAHAKMLLLVGRKHE